MQINRQLYTLKFNSSRLKRYNYNINITYSQAKENDEIAPLAESQMLRTIRKALIENGDTHRTLNRDRLEDLYELKKINKLTRNQKQEIIDMAYIPEYVTIVMEHDTHYNYMFYNGIIINGEKYKRLSCSAGQARVSTVVFCSEKILNRVNEILDNGRDKTVKFSPSKFSAYKGLYSSSTKVVTTPRFCVVPDFESETEFMCNWVTETSYDEDDIIEERMINRKFNRWDGMGLISPDFAKVWQEDLELDYLPSDFGIRQSYIKGMLAVFDFLEFCKVKNNGDYIIDSIYKDEFGNPIKVDLREIDVILTESQFKLWNCYKSLDEYKKNCIDNELYWGVGLYADNNPKNKLKLNYQFLQANNIQKDDIPKLCEDFVNWITNINYEDAYSSLLFLLGTDMTKEDIQQFLKQPSNWWIKTLMIDHSFIKSKYIKQKIYKLAKVRLENGYVGSIFVEGNNQTLISDPYGFCQYICGQEVTGLIDKDRYYINYWNQKGVNKVIGMRPPLTSRAEVLPMQLSNTEEQQYWFRYITNGIIVNIHGAEVDYWAGADFDKDFLSTTSNEILVKSPYKNEYPVCYEAPKPDKFVFSEEDLFVSDKFAFGSIIGSITNKSTSGHALLPYIENKYGKNSDHYKILENRVKMTCKLQNAQIDKAKLGRDVKEIPKIWIDRKFIIEKYGEDTFESNMYQEILLDRHPYFFIHLYPQTKAKYKKHVKEYEGTCYNRFGIGIFELESLKNKTDEQKQYLELFHKYMPVIYNNSVMNNLCRYLEDVGSQIKMYIRSDNCDERVEVMLSGNPINEELYERLKLEYKDFLSRLKGDKELKRSKTFALGKKNKFDIAVEYGKFRNKIKDFGDQRDIKDCLIKIFYEDVKPSNKDLLWETYGEEIFNEVSSKNCDKIYFPIKDYEGELKYEEDTFRLEEVDICSMMKLNMEKE